MTEIHVAAAVIFNPEATEILIARRPDHVHQGGLWEFPGGKVRSDESVYAALCRELQEELAIRVIEAEPMMQIRHTYRDRANPDGRLLEKVVYLDFWRVSRFSGDPVGNEGQPVCWVKRELIRDYSFPAANRQILECIMSESGVSDPAPDLLPRE